MDKLHMAYFCVKCLYNCEGVNMKGAGASKDLKRFLRMKKDNLNDLYETASKTPIGLQLLKKLEIYK